MTGLSMDYNIIVANYSDMVTRICLTHTGNPENAKDCFQNTFIKLFEKKPAFESEEHLKAWLIRVAINECRSFFRRFKQTDVLELEKIHELWYETKYDETLTGVMTLEPKYRTVIYLFYYEDYPLKEIAKLLKLPENTVKTRLSRARQQLKTMIGDENYA